ncbi:2-hydroxychromene-2-carboxylate isomerase [Sinorhizobium sp. BG8]|uniref:2-hydroxychromene-2-carboxylate isomerase n=1 Tax=Sinorhizobium sp. BG8 TaxID=2613773 RepID=UPI00193CF338|nr:2-hydroxychromene-2-carboxylate isomerase [Sinorhizobium sp. BG8]QRM57304.1 2-hydroxychromene-2-carboxylate isomerase [Sinorhizobium sp. BG8]
MATIDFWFTLGSTYTFLAVMRLPQISEKSGIDFRWRPFNVRAIMIEMDNIPFAKKPVKAAYMWRDIERRAAMYSLPAHLPIPYPLPELERANRVAIVGANEGWCEAYTVEAYRRWFTQGQAPGSEPNLSASISQAGHDPARVLELADSTDGIDALYQATEEARGLGIFGSPSFIVDDELFWGHDRLDDAISWRNNLDRATPG